MSELPRDLAALDRELRGARFGPRASLGAEIAGRAARGERPRGGPARVAWPLTAALVFCALAATAAGVQEVLGRTTTRDLCCGDLDGSPDTDDGVLVTVNWHGDVQRLVVYEDRDGSRSLSVGDVMHLDRPSTLQLDPQLAQAFTARTQCCSDFDGEGEDDDGVMVGMAGGRVVMATLFDARNPGGPIRRPR